MRRSMFVRRAVVTALLAVSPFAVAAPGAASGPCTVPRGAKTIAADGGSRVWRVTRDGGYAAPDIREYFACQPQRRPLRFERGDAGASSLIDVPAAAIRGRFLAYGRVRQQGLGTSRATVVVRDLRTRRATFARRAVSRQLEIELFHDVVVRRSGSVAWIASNIVGSEGLRVFEVYKQEGGRSQLLDFGTDIAPRSLRLGSGGELRWVRGRDVKRATLD